MRSSTTYDLIAVGGGPGGSALAKVMAEHGVRMLVLETETRFRDRVRGESVLSWGVAEARELGVYDTIMAAGGHELPWWDTYQGPTRVEHRNLTDTTTPQVPSIAFYHPGMQEALIQAAASAGAEVLRGARVSEVKTDGVPTVTAEDDAVHVWLNPPMGLLAILFPQGSGRLRAYLGYPAKIGYRLSGDLDIRRFVEHSLKAGAEAELYSKAKPVGPLATFDGAASWVEHPYRNGAVLIGDAAAASNPCLGQGLSLTVRDVRVLRDRLLGHQDWDDAGHAYAEEHARYYGVNHTFEQWITQILFETGPEADARRARAMPLWEEDPSRRPDILHSGPDQTLDEATRWRVLWGGIGADRGKPRRPASCDRHARLRIAQVREEVSL